jgi:hypothetical protein
LLPFVPFALDSCPGLIDEAQHVLETVKPRQRSLDLQVALAVFSGSVFPDVPWLAKIGEEALMDSPVHQQILSRGEARGELKGRRASLEKQIRHRLGQGRKVSLLVKGLARCNEALLDKIGIAVLETTKENLPAAIERLIAKSSKAPKKE